MVKYYTNGGGGSPSNGWSSRGWLDFRYFNRFNAIQVELKGEFIYPAASF
jgi:hypothetical protein